MRARLPLCEACNTTPEGFLNPYAMVEELARLCDAGDHIVPCSSGGAFTVMMQAFELRQGQTMLTNKGLASMGYGLSAAIGVALADRHHRTVLVEGDGGFSQNLQELATVAVNDLNLKIFLFCNEGYASIRMTQKNYFQGSYVGCDVRSGLWVSRLAAPWKGLRRSRPHPLRWVVVGRSGVPRSLAASNSSVVPCAHRPGSKAISPRSPAASVPRVAWNPIPFTG